MKTESGRVYWVTGLSGSGKTTIAWRIAASLREAGNPVVVLDGDELRAVLAGADATGFSRSDRLALGLRYARLARTLAIQGVDTVVATISMFNEVYNWNRENIECYTEVFLEVPMVERRRRDSRNIYSRVEDEDKEVAGLNIQVDFPENPTVRLTWTDGDTIDVIFERLVEELGDLNVANLGLP